MLATAGTWQWFTNTGLSAGSQSAALTPRLYIQGNGNVGIGYTNPATPLEVANTATVSNDGSSAEFNFESYRDATGASFFNFRHARGTRASPTVVQDGDYLGVYRFEGYTAGGYAWRDYAKIQCIVDGTPGTDDAPGRLEFQTTPDGSVSPSLRMVIKNDGKIGIGTSAPTQSLHTVGLVYASTSAASTAGIALGGSAETLPSTGYPAYTFFQSGSALYFSTTTVTNTGCWKQVLTW
jgi:hypothetical protein